MRCSTETPLRNQHRPKVFSTFHLLSSILYSLRVRWQKITIVGVGLLGGSLGMAIKRRKLACRVEGYVRRAASIIECRALRAVDRATQDLRSAVVGADLVILCTPLSQMLPLVKQMLPVLKRGAVVTDVGSVKTSVVRELESELAKAHAHFVGSHPMAGAEKSGVKAARPNLFVNAACVVTPTRKSDRTAVRTLEQFWKSLGGRVIQLAPEVHDRLVSRTSHLPHIVAATLASSVLDPAQPGPQTALCANGFRDTTRIASGSPEMWRDIALANRRHLANSLRTYIADLKKIQRLIGKADAKAIARFLETAKARRDRWCACGASPSPE